jgi:D-alanyl-D-alanine carboxypeptidase/D-alanyl-D-alanine-endopeptidase (penicillin-binding protein 4)
MSIVDGFGLSRMDEVAPDQLALVAARGRPWFGTFYAVLPVAGVADRMRSGPCAAGCAAPPRFRVHAETGSQTGISALSGYVTAADGEEPVFAMVGNDALDGPPAVEDAVAVRLARYAGAVDTHQAAVLPVPAASARTRDARLECSGMRAC